MVQWWTAALLLGAAVTPSVPINGHGPFGKRAPSPDVLTDKLVPLRTVTVPVTSGPLRSASSLRHVSKPKGLMRRGTGGGITKIRNYYQLNYVAEVQWGNQTMYMLLDTGSSDIWVLQEGYECLDSNGASLNVRSSPSQSSS